MDLLGDLIVKRIILAALVLSFTVAGCATKRYPIATPISAAEVGAMQCRDLQLELIRAEQVQLQISNTAQADWRSAAGFLGDFGIGNAMAKSEAEKAVRLRMESIRTAQSQKNCIPAN
jgi:hypothetical protein